MTYSGQQFASPSEALAHFGVKGMRWGVVNEDQSNAKSSSKNVDKNTKSKTASKPINSQSSKQNPVPGSAEPTGKRFGLTKKQALIGAGVLIGVGLTAAVVADVGGVRTNTLRRGFNESTMASGEHKLQEIFDVNRSRTGGTLPKGQMISRMSKVAEQDIRPGAYATYKPIDVAHYKFMFAQGGYQINIKALEDIKMPDLKTRLDTMTELFDSDKAIRKNIVSSQRTVRAKLWASTASNEDLAKYTYARLDAPDWKKGVGKRYIEALIKKGYGAMLDDVDSGRLSGDPVILLNQKLFEISSRTKMTKAELDDAHKTFKSLLAS